MAKFVWADLSTYNLSTAKKFYSEVFGWNWHNLKNYIKNNSDDNYLLALASDNNPAAGLFLMPEKFAQIRMPSFWMSYLAVADIEKTVILAKQSGAIIEVSPETFGVGKIALIRDPAGAGFTVCEGIDFDTEKKSFGKMIWNELFISDLNLVSSFYKNTFDWHFELVADGQYWILNKKNECIASAQVASDEVRGKKQYWAVHFSVSSLAKTKTIIEKSGGKVWDEHRQGNMFASDSENAFFIVNSTNNN